MAKKETSYGETEATSYFRRADQLLAGADPKTAFAKDGLLDELKKAFAERALNAEIDHHLANGEEDGRPNSRNGYGRESVLTETGKIELEVPRDRLSTFDPQLIAKYQRRFPGFDEKIVSMYARGMSTREIPRPFARSLWGRRLRRSRQRGHGRRPRRDRRMAKPAAGAALCAGVLRRHPGQGARRRHGAQQSRLRRPWGSTRRTKEILGLWIEQTEGAKFWLRVMNELKNRGVEDVLIAVVDGLKGFPDAITAVFPQTQVQTCIVHLIRNSLDFVSYKDRKAVAAALKQIYRAKDAAAGEEELNAFAEGHGAKNTRQLPSPGDAIGARSSRSSLSPTKCVGSSIRQTPSSD